MCSFDQEVVDVNLGQELIVAIHLDVSEGTVFVGASSGKKRIEGRCKGGQRIVAWTVEFPYQGHLHGSDIS